MARIRFYAAAKQAAGNREEQDLTVGSLGELTEALGRAHGERMTQVLARCSFLVNGTAIAGGASDVALSDSTVVDVLPPFAGG